MAEKINGRNLHESTSCLHGGESFETIGAEFTTLGHKDRVIRADVTDAWYDPAPNVSHAISVHLPWILRNSPPTNAQGLVKIISEVRGVPKEAIMVGGGSSDLMYLFFPNYPVEKPLILDPTYGEYAHIFQEILGKTPRRILQKTETKFRIGIEDIVQTSSGADMVVLVNPNNPTGQVLTRTEVVELHRRLPKRTMLFIDETYIEYAGNESVETLAAEKKNVVVLKSMSKIYALSGARVGYLIGHPDTIATVRKYVPPWSVSLFGQIAGVEALKNEEYYTKKIDETVALRTEFTDRLGSISGVAVYQGLGNFVLLGVQRTGKKAQFICDGLAKQGIFVRNPDSMSTQFNGDFIRIAVREKESNERIYLALREVLTNE